MPGLRTELVIHSRHPQTVCALCGGAWEQHYVGVSLFDGDEQLGDLCPRCLARGPRPSAELVRARAARLQTLCGQLAETIERALPRQLAREAGEFEGLVAAYRSGQRELRALLDRIRHEFAAARDAIDQSDCLAGAPAEEAVPSRRELAERRERFGRVAAQLAQHGKSLADVAERAAAEDAWPTTVADLMDVERFLFWQRFPGIRPEDLHRLVDRRYQEFLADQPAE